MPSGKERSVLSFFSICSERSASCCDDKGVNALFLDVERVRLEGVEGVDEVGEVLIFLLAGAAKTSAGAEAKEVDSGDVSKTSASDVGSFTCTMHTETSDIGLAYLCFSMNTSKYLSRPANGL